MSFRVRLFLGILIGALIPLGALAYGVQHEMARRLRAEYDRRGSAMAEAVANDLALNAELVRSRLAAMIGDLSRDNRFRRAVLQEDLESRQYLLDYAGQAMNLSGLSMLQIQDSTGRILSSGHFRNEFDQLQPELPSLMRSHAAALTLVRARTPEESLDAFARLDSFRVAGRRFDVIGGVAVPAVLFQRPARDPDIGVRLGSTVELSRPRIVQVVQRIALPYIDLLREGGPVADTSYVEVTRSLDTLHNLRRSVNLWFLAALGLTAAVALMLAGWLSSRISRPVRELARKTAEIDLDRLDGTFESDRPDEIGALSRLLGEMTARLRASSARLREAERRAAVGELSQQVNHDIKNGLAPIRNVLRHFAQVAEQEPARLADVFGERKGTLDSSIEYLDTLARNYARLSPSVERAACDVNSVVERILRNTSVNGTVLQAKLSDASPTIVGDTLMLRRILENLVGNAVDSVAGKAGGMVTVTTEVVGESGETARVRITVADTGPGMTRTELDQAFDDFYTTKPGGTGLGLSIVRRLILDLAGTLRVETAPGAGTSVIVELPADSRGRAA
jgi:signal transduction histidine kinase